MGNPLLVLWHRLSGREQTEARRVRWRTPVAVRPCRPSATIFLILRRMRAPLIILIMIFAVSVLGLTLIPGQDAAGQPWRMGFFDAFYFMSYTATTIGFGEIPYPFTDAQRLWVMVTIYLTVIGWAYAISVLLTLLQDRAFRQALALQHFTRKVARLREPFLLIAGYGQTGELLGRSFDALGRRFTVIDSSDARIESLDLDPHHADVPGLVGDARNPHHLGVAGLDHPYCEGVLALTDNDEVNLAVTMAAALLRPELPVVARTISPAVAAPHARVRRPHRDRSVRPLRRPPAPRAAVTGLLPVVVLAGERTGGRAAPRGGSADGRHGGWCAATAASAAQLTATLRAEGLDVTIIEPGAVADARRSRSSSATGPSRA